MSSGSCQVNPRRRPDEPRTVVDIADRRAELSGNLSLHQELHFIEKVNQLLDEGLLAAGDRYRNVVVRVIELTRSRLPRRWVRSGVPPNCRCGRRDDGRGGERSSAARFASGAITSLHIGGKGWRTAAHPVPRGCEWRNEVPVT